MTIKVREHDVRRPARPDPPTALTPAGVEDARALALELAGLRAQQLADPMPLGLVLEAGESGCRSSALWLRWMVDGRWGEAQHCQVLLTNRRVVARLPVGGLRSFWFGSLVGLDIDLPAGHVVLDYGDGRPRALSGEGVAVVAVAAVAGAYGVEALASHEALAALRS